jgi:hypothetical protein
MRRAIPVTRLSSVVKEEASEPFRRTPLRNNFRLAHIPLTIRWRLNKTNHGSRQG